ncbi:MAG: hypothetical protein R6V83_12220 [Candidatus Thorarchaeota archaeon]
MSVTGLLEEIGAYGFGPSDTGLYIALESAMDYFDSEEVSQIAVKLESDDSDFVDSASDDIEEFLLNEVSVTSTTASLNTVSEVFVTVELLLAGIGIMNIMSISLVERTRNGGSMWALPIPALFLTVLAMMKIVPGPTISLPWEEPEERTVTESMVDPLAF